ncbi:MAG TPA: hypothetical protein VMW30_10355 [Candidatus Paceibacterota bacterium]|nr:hypothetical protein [Candidatus Paceibacterota bacterium]
MNIKTKTLVLGTVGAFALSYAIVGSNAFADTNSAPVPAVPSTTATASATASATATPAPLVSPIPAPAGLTSPSAGITQDDEGDDLDDLIEDGLDVAEGEDDEISDDDSDDQLITVDVSGGINLSSDTKVDLGEDD